MRLEIKVFSPDQNNGQGSSPLVSAVTAEQNRVMACQWGSPMVVPEALPCIAMENAPSARGACACIFRTELEWCFRPS